VLGVRLHIVLRAGLDIVLGVRARAWLGLVPWAGLNVVLRVWMRAGLQVVLRIRPQTGFKVVLWVWLNGCHYRPPP
jgi:hypothetical protein